jgi:hypothetical protein
MTRVIEVDKRKKINIKDYIRRTALDSDHNELIKENLVVKEGGKVKIVYIVAPEMVTGRLVNVLKSKLEFDKHNRTQGVVAQSKVFGYLPRETIRKDYCSSTAFARENPEEHRLVCEFGKTLSQYYKQHAAELYDDHLQKTNEKIKADWRIEDTPFTSGIINKNTALRYHYDAGNISGVCSNMVCFRQDCMGGHLSIPEFGIGLEIANKSLTFFDGQDIVHGVTPFKMTSADGYRFTLVYYTLHQMWKCEPINEEIARIRQLRVQRETTRYKRLTGQLDNDILARQLKSKADQYAKNRPTSHKSKYVSRSKK